MAEQHRFTTEYVYEPVLGYHSELSYVSEPKYKSADTFRGVISFKNNIFTIYIDKKSHLDAHVIMSIFQYQKIFDLTIK